MSRTGYESVGGETEVGGGGGDTSPVSITSDVPTSGGPPQEPASLEKDFYQRPIQTLSEISLALKIHLGVAIGVSSLCFLIWHFTTPGDPSLGVWWWIFPLFLFCITLSLHHNFAQQKYMEGIIWAAVAVNTMLFFTYKVTSPTGEYSYPWFFHPIILSAMILVPIHFKLKQDPVYSTPFNILWLEYWFINLNNFCIWAFLPLHHPWFFYPLIVLGTPLLLYRVKTHYKETRIAVLVGIPLAALNLIFFIAWGFTHIGWPWFIIPLAITGGVEILLIWRFKAHTHQVISDEPAYPAAGADASGYQYPPTGPQEGHQPYAPSAPSYSQPSYTQ